MVRNHSVSGIHAVLVVSTELAGICGCASEFLDLGKDRGEDVSVVVGSDVMKDRHQTLEAQTGVDVLVGQ